MKHIRCFTGLRGIASLFVILCHCCGNGFGMIWSVSESGNMAVYFFFALSGYLLMKRGLAEIKPSKDAPPNSFCNLNMLYYCIRRFARVYPAYAAELILCAIMIIYMEKQGSQFRDSVQTVHWSQFFFSGVNNHLWTVKTEIIFYIFILPVILGVSSGLLSLDYKYLKSSRYSLLAPFYTLITVYMMRMQYQNLYAEGNWGGRNNFSYHLPSFWYGCLGGIASHYYHQIYKINIHFNTKTRKVLVEVVTYALLMKLYLSNQCTSATYKGSMCLTHPLLFKNNVSLFPVYALLLLVLEITYSTNSVAKAMSLPFFYVMGEISYSAYLVQFIIIFPYKFHSEIRSLDGAVHVVLLVYLLSYIMYHLVELKGVKYGNLLIKKIKGQTKYSQFRDQNYEHTLKIVSSEPQSASIDVNELPSAKC